MDKIKIVNNKLENLVHNSHSSNVSKNKKEANKIIKYLLSGSAVIKSCFLNNLGAQGFMHAG